MPVSVRTKTETEIISADNLPLVWYFEIVSYDFSDFFLCLIKFVQRF